MNRIETGEKDIGKQNLYRDVYTTILYMYIYIY